MSWPCHDHRRAVPDEAHVEAREVDVHGARVIVRGDDADALAAGVLRRELAQGHARRRGAGAAVPPRPRACATSARRGEEEGTREGREEEGPDGRGGEMTRERRRATDADRRERARRDERGAAQSARRGDIASEPRERAGRACAVCEARGGNPRNRRG